MKIMFIGAIGTGKTTLIQALENDSITYDKTQVIEKGIRIMAKNYTNFTHEKCEYFPCHQGANKENFNCLFCYCPLYMLGDKCGGNFVYLKNGFKDCSNCLFPHRKENYDKIVARFSEIANKMAEERNRNLSL